MALICMKEYGLVHNFMSRQWLDIVYIYMDRI